MTNQAADAVMLPLTPPRAAGATQEIKNYILLNRLKPGDLLPTESELGASLGVSRSSIREAMRRLAALDIVEVRHGYGTYVGSLSLAPLVEGLVFRGVLSPGDDMAALREVVDVRIELDLALAERLAKIMAGTQNPDLEEFVAEMQLRRDRGESITEPDRAFHSALASRLGNRLVEQLVTAFWEVHTAVYPQLGLAPAEGLDDTVRAHAAMLTAAQSGDASALRKAIVEHYRPLQEALGMPIDQN